MAWQLSRDGLGPLLSSPHSCWPIWSGGVCTIILYAPMPRCGSGSCSRESEVAIFWRNETFSVLQPWQRGEPTDDGRREKCCAIPSLRCHAPSWEHDGHETTPWERAGGGLG